MMIRYRLRQWGPLLAYVILALAVAFALQRNYDVAHRADRLSIANRALALRVATEATARVNESCIQSEGRYENAVQQLSSTYKYLSQLTPSELNNTLNKFVIRQLPQTEQNARDSQAPAFCDKPNVGAPEPNPIFPERPAAVTKLLRQAGINPNDQSGTIPPTKR